MVYGFSTGMDSRKAHAPPKEAPLQVQVQVQGEQWVEVEVALSRPSKKHVLHTHTSVVLEGVCVRVRVRVCVQGGVGASGLLGSAPHCSAQAAECLLCTRSLLLAHCSLKLRR